MIKLPTEHAESLARAIAVLENDPNFKVIKSWFNASFEDTKNRNIYLTGEHTIRGQGYAEALRDITLPLNNPRLITEKIAEQKRQRELMDTLNEQADL